MPKISDLGDADLSGDDLATGLGALLFAATKAEVPGIKKETFTAASKAVRHAKGAAKVAKTAAGVGAAVTSATGLTVAATSGAGIASGLAAAGGVVGGGMALGPGVLAAGPAYVASVGFNSTLFKEEAGLNEQEAKARSRARTATNAGAAAGVLGAGAATVAAGASGPAIMGTLATIGGTVGGGALAGVGLLAVAPVAAAGAAGYAAYRLLGGGKDKSKASVPKGSEVDGDVLALVVGDGEESYSVVGTAHWDGTVLSMLGGDGEPAFPIPPSSYDRIEPVPKAKRADFGGAAHVLMLALGEAPPRA